MQFINYLPVEQWKRLLEFSPLFHLLKEVELQLRASAGKRGLLGQGLCSELKYFHLWTLDMFRRMCKPMNLARGNVKALWLLCFVFRWQGPRFHWCSWCSVGMWRRADPFDPLSPQPQRVPSLPTWVIPARDSAQTEAGWYSISFRQKASFTF